jgi:hypothetical protein
LARVRRVVLPLYRYTTRGRVHTEVAELLDRTVRKSGNKRWMIKIGVQKIALEWGGRG